MSPRQLGFLVAALSLAADQLSKNILLYGYGFKEMQSFDRVEVLPFFDLVMVWNKGISYGLLQSGSTMETLALMVFQLAASIGLTWWLLRIHDRLLAVSLGFLIGGALGNVIDRMLYGAVADFFHFYAWGRGWYVFNIADAAITIGVMLLLADMVMKPRSEPVQERPREPVIRK